MDPINPAYRRWFILTIFGIILLAFFLVFPLIKDLAVVVIISLVLMYVFRPGVEALERYGISRTIAILILYAIFTGLLILLLQFLVPMIIKEIGTLTQKLQEVDPKGIYEKFVGWINRTIPGVSSIIQLDSSRFDVLIEKATNAITQFVQESAILLAGVVNIFSLSIIVPFLTFFLLKDGPQITKKWIEKVPNRFFEMTLSLVHRIDDQLGAYLRSILLESVIVWLLTWPGLAILGVKFSLLLALVHGAFNAIPFLGPVIAYLPIGLVVLITYSPVGWGLFWMAVILLFVQIIDNLLLKPLIISRSVPVHPAVVLVGVLVGGKLAGVIGMFIAVPVFAIIQVIILDSYNHLKNYRII